MATVFYVVAASACIHGYLKINPYSFWAGICGLGICLIILISIIKQDRIAPNKQNPNKAVIKTRQTIHFKQSTINNNITFKNQHINTSHGKTYIEQWIINSNNNNKSSYHMLCIHGYSLSDAFTQAFIPYIIDNIGNIPCIKSITAIHLYGRGLSDAPLTPNTIQLFISQISDVITNLELNGPLIIAGLSMGGAIVTKFADTYPHRIHKLLTFAPGGLLKPSLITTIIAAPIIGEMFLFAIRNGFKSLIGAGLDVERYGDDARAAEKRHGIVIDNTLKYHDGYLYSLLSSLRYFPFCESRDTFDNLYERQDFDNKRWLFVWGDNDKVCPIKKDDEFKNVKILKISGAGHCDIVQKYCLKQYGKEMIQWIES